MSEARRQILYELISSSSGLALAIFMWGHLVLVGSILAGARGFDWLATVLEKYFIAQPTVMVVFVLFLVHAVFAARKIPAGLAERRRMLEIGRKLKRSSAAGSVDHADSLLWIWQVRTGIVILVLGSFHIVLLGFDVLTPMFGERIGIESATTLSRVRGGLWLPYAILLLSVEFHASVGLYRLAIKWGIGSRLSRHAIRRIENAVLWGVLVLGGLSLLVLAGVLDPPLEFLLDTEPR